VNTSQAANDADFHKCKKSPRAELGQLALGLFSGRPMGTFIVLRNRNRKLSNFDHFFGGAGPQRRTKGGWAVGGEKQSTAVPEEPPKKTDRKNQTRECRAVPLETVLPFPWQEAHSTCLRISSGLCCVIKRLHTCPRNRMTLQR